MTTQVFATKDKMTQAWTKNGKRVAVTCMRVANNAVVGKQVDEVQHTVKLEIGYGQKKLKNMTKPLRSKLEKSGFSFGVRGIRQVTVAEDSALQKGDVIKVEQVFQIGDIVNVQGITKGRGFAGAMKRHGFSGGPKTHGQSDRWRAVGSIGQRTTPGRVFRGKKMPGHYGVDLQTVKGLVVLYIDPTTQEFWLSGPVPGHIKSMVAVAKTGETKAIELDEKASGIVRTEVTTEVVAEEAPTVETIEAEATPEIETEGGAQ
jgi:large subunit ribosomal protein L3